MDDKNLIELMKTQRSPLPRGFEERQDAVLQRVLDGCAKDKSPFVERDPAEKES